MDKIIIYNDDAGRMVYVVPTPECLLTRTVMEIALKDVPAGKPFKVIDRSDLPADMRFRDAWQIPDAELIDGVGAEYNTWE
jgi:hypothetical protein